MGSDEEKQIIQELRNQTIGFFSGKSSLLGGLLSHLATAIITAASIVFVVYLFLNPDDDLNKTPRKQQKSSLADIQDQKPKRPEVDIEAMIKKHEGFSDTVYLCPANSPVVGYGSSVKVGAKLPQHILDLMFEYGIKNAQDDADSAIEEFDIGDIHPVRYAAIVDIAYMVGRGSLFEFKTMMFALRDGRYKDAATAWMKTKCSKTAGQKRAIEIAKMLETGRSSFEKQPT